MFNKLTESGFAVKRDETLDIAKGIGIILVVLGHSISLQTTAANIIYSFHMPLFFIASGYFFKTKWLYNKWEFTKRKIKGLYLPFIKWSLIFLLLHNLFMHIGIINSLYGNIQGDASYYYTIKDICRNGVNIICRMGGYEPFLLGAYWFMRSLFIGSLLLCFASFALNKFVKNKDYAILITGIAFLIIGGGQKYFDIYFPIIPQGGYREIMAVFFISMGYGFRLIQTRIENAMMSIIALILLITLGLIAPTSLSSTATFTNWMVIPITGIAGFEVIFLLSREIEIKTSQISKSLSYVGRNSFYILTFHFLMFKPVSLLKCYMYGLDWHMIGCHPVIFEHNDYFWIIYTISGVGLSLILASLLKRCKLA